MQVAKVCIVGCFAVSRSARIGLIVLALAIAVVGAGAVGMAFLPAAVTEPVVKPVTQSVELLTGDDKPETITVDFDEQPAVLGISNYPRIQLGAMRYTTDTSLIDRASELLKGKTFKRWYGYASYRAKANDMVGGCHSSIELDTANGAKLCDVSYDPGYEGNEGPGIYIMDGDVAYVMEGNETELNDFMGQCIRMPMNRPACPTRRLHAIAGLPVHGCSRMRCPGPSNREVRVRRRSRDRDYHKGTRPLCSSSRFVSICNILAAKSGPGVTDLDF